MSAVSQIFLEMRLSGRSESAFEIPEHVQRTAAARREKEDHPDILPIARFRPTSFPPPEFQRAS